MSSLTVDLLSEYRKGIVVMTPREQTESDALQQMQSPLHYDPPDDESLSEGAVSMTSRESSHFTRGMQEFFADVELIKKHIRAIQMATGKVLDVDQSYGMATTSAQEAALSAESSRVVADASKCAQTAKQMISLLREANDRLRVSGSSKQGEQRIRDNLSNTLTRKFVEVMKGYQNAQQQFKGNIKKKVTRQVQIVKPDATRAEVEALVSDPATMGGLFQSAILSGDPNGDIANLFQTAKDKHSEMLALERSIAGLNQMFLDFALLIEQQGEMLDQIEYNVKEAEDYVDEATQQLVESVALQIGLRKKQCLCLILGLVIVGVIALLIYMFVIKK